MIQATTDTAAVHWVEIAVTLITFGVTIGVMKARGGSLEKGQTEIAQGQKDLSEKFDKVAEQGTKTATDLEGFKRLEQERHQKLDETVDEMKGDIKRVERTLFKAPGGASA